MTLVPEGEVVVGGPPGAEEETETPAVKPITDLGIMYHRVDEVFNINITDSFNFL